MKDKIGWVALRLLATVGLMTLWSGAASAQSFYDINTIQKIEIQFSASNWDYQLDTATAGAEGYLVATWIKINGVQFDSVGVKYKGNSSYNVNRVKNPFHIKLDYYNNDADYLGVQDIKLGNGFKDPSMLREVMGYQILSNYMDCSRSNYAQVYVNGTLLGLYTNTEDVGKPFAADHFYSSDGNYFKCNPTYSSGGAKSNLRYIDADSSSYFNRYELQSDIGWNDMVTLCNTVTNNTANITSALDLDKAIWMLAFDNATVNLDSYLGAIIQNYYLYKDHTGHYNPVLWDLNECFGVFTNTGTSQLTTNAQLQQLTTTLHINDADWPLIKAVLNNTMYRKMYFAHLRTIVSEMFAANQYQALATNIQTIIDTAVSSDPNKLYTYANFQNGLTQDVSGGMGNIIAIGNLMGPRVTYLNGTIEFGYAQPVISNMAVNPATPAYGGTATFTAHVTNTNAVYIGYRYAFTEKFTRVAMYDDGAHGDGAANDNVYGANIPVNAAKIQYYFYAENTDAGVFSPARAEYEFYDVTASIPLPDSGAIRINEFVAQNNSGAVDENGQFEDWIELYNTTNAAINLFGLYLTDDPTIPTKFAIPDGTVIPAYGFMAFWADQDTADLGTYPHANFKLSASGETIVLSDVTGTIHDSITYGQQVVDVSQGRCPDGTGAFASVSSPTFDASNCFTAVDDIDNGGITLQIFPVPAHDLLHVVASAPVKGEVEVMNAFGQTIARQSWKGETTFDTGNWATGMYFLRFGQFTKKIVVSH